MTFETLGLETDARGVATLTLARPDKHNALSAAMIAELAEAVGRIQADPGVRAVVLAAEGRSFCAGGDLAWMREQMRADRATRMIEAGKLAHMLRALNDLDKPLIGRVQGNAFGGGIGLMAVCDAVVAVEGARFALTEVRLGLIPATIGPYVVARLGEARARRLFFSGRMFGAGEAQALGLVAEVVSEGALEEAVAAEVAPYLGAAPRAVAAAKAQVRALGPRIDDAVIEDSVRRLADVWEGEEAPEGVSAFFDKRKPWWAA